MAPSLDKPWAQKPSIEEVLKKGELEYQVMESEGTYSAIASWVKRSQKPKTGLARTSRTE